MIPAEKLVHSYDTDRRANRCGVPGQTSSTKHAAGVTCPECRRALSGEPGAERPAGEDAAVAHDDGASR